MPLETNGRGLITQISKVNNVLFGCLVKIETKKKYKKENNKLK